MTFTNNEFPLPLLSFSEADSPFEAKVVADPLRPGFGVTLGVALRRVLLSSITFLHVVQYFVCIVYWCWHKILGFFCCIAKHYTLVI